MMLLQRPKPYPDESLESFFIRVANKNGYSDVNRFLVAVKRYLLDVEPKKFQTFPTDICRINPYSSNKHSISRTHALHQLSQLTFNEPVDLLGIALNRNQMQFSPSTTALIRGAEVIPRSLLRKGAIPCCPCCLGEHGYASYRWHFSGYEYCHEHDVKLIERCSCGAIYDYRYAGLSGVCTECGENISASQENHEPKATRIASWLAGDDVKPLPDVPLSYRWGFMHWWSQISSSCKTRNNGEFLAFWEHWPNSFHKLIGKEIDFNFEYCVLSKNDLRVKDILGKTLFSSIQLPDRNFRSNIILKEMFQYIETHLWDDNGKLANLRMNMLEICVLLNCSREQVTSMIEQGLLTPNRQLGKRDILIVTEYTFYLGDVYCLWLSEFQSDEFNRSFYLSRW